MSVSWRASFLGIGGRTVTFKDGWSESDSQARMEMAQLLKSETAALRSTPHSHVKLRIDGREIYSGAISGYLRTKGTGSFDITTSWLRRDLEQIERIFTPREW